MQTAYKPGEVVAGYVVESSIGSGGMGTVYRVRGKEGQPLALKVVQRSQGISDEEFAGRLSREANVARVVRHPGLVRVHAHGVLDGARAYLVMDLLEGRDLDRCLAQQALSLLEYVELVREALDVLDAAHTVTTLDGTPQPIVHRDLKPSNLFLLDRPSGGVRLKVVDFGLVRQHGAKTLTRAGAGFGTICYMAPEQFTGARTASAATDLWSIGVMLYEAVAGSRPFITDDMASTLSAIGRGHPARLDTLDPACPARFAALVDACLEPDRDRRTSSASAVMHELDALLEEPAFISYANGRRALDPERRAGEPTPSGRTAVAYAETQRSDAPIAPRMPEASPVAAAASPTPSSPGPIELPPFVGTRSPIAVATVAAVALTGLGLAVYLGSRDPVSLPGASSSLAGAIPMPPTIPQLAVQATVSIPPAFALRPLALTLDGRSIATLRDAAAGDAPLVITLPSGAHVLALESGPDVVARTRVDARGGAVDVVFASPCPDGMVYVSAGTTFVGAPSASATPSSQRVASAFCIDREEASFEDVRHWCSATAAADARVRRRDCDTVDRCMASSDPVWSRGGRGGTDAWPLPCMGPQEAMHYCADRAATGRLPTGPEWLRAASGGRPSALPWTDGPDTSDLGGHAIVYAGTGSAYRDFERFAAPRISGTSPFGLLDTVGSLAEWSCESTADGRCAEPSMRGGSFLLGAGEILAAGGLFAAEHGTEATDAVGVRCVADAAAP